MDRRTLLALLLTAVVIVLTPRLFPSAKRPTPATDTLAARVDTAAPNVDTSRRAPVAQPRIGPAPATTPAPVAIRPETTVVRTPHAIHGIVSPGATPATVTLPAYHSLRDGAERETPVQLLEAGDRLFSLRLLTERDTIALDSVRFRAEPQRREGTDVVQTFTSLSPGVPVSLTYRFHPDSFVVRVDGSTAVPGVRALLVGLPGRIRSEEANVVDDTRHLALAYMTRNAEVHNISFRDLERSEPRVDTSAMRWISERNKYFVTAVIPTGRDTLFRGLVAQRTASVGNEATGARALAVLPLSTGNFSLRVYAGPQAWDHLRATAPQLENVNPYGGWIHDLVQPFATLVMRLLLWMRDTFRVSYGWVLVIFGVAVRILLWPLNQSAMRSSLKMQRLQPELAEIQKKYRDNPERQRDAIMKVYQEHGMSPFTPLLGCLPMLLPMPILFALYFVFSNTIELRGVSFLWLPDLSLKDPYYITPLFMGVSMFVLSWIGMRGMPPSPQGKMMSYVMPVMFTVLFWNFASGLNLYYAVQNIAALPQQWLLARERTTKPAATDPGKGTKRERS